jgi:hypothetical protein
MEPNNIENQFAEKLNAREIKPSPMAWDRLDAMLTVAEKPKRNFSWLYIAASFLGFVLITTVFFSQTETLIDVEKKEVVLEDATNTKINFKSQSQKSILNSDIQEVVVSSKNKSPKIKFKNQVQKSIFFSTNKDEVATQIVNKNTITKNQSIITRADEANWRSNQKTNQKNQNQIANNLINSPTTNNQQPTTKESKPNYVNVDALLAAVEQPTSSQKSEKIFSQKANINVNANSLLSQVDGEIELTFREKVIKSVNRNFQTVKVAFTNRNNN